jgi:hypothetical protein
MKEHDDIVYFEICLKMVVYIVQSIGPQSLALKIIILSCSFEKFWQISIQQTCSLGQKLHEQLIHIQKEMDLGV